MNKKMVVTHWESSNRPLFIRTVWKDGHHHVVFRKDEEITSQISQTSRRSISSGISQNSGKKIITADNASFKVPSVKLLLASLRNFKGESKTKRCKTENYTRNFAKTAITIDIIPSDSLRYNDINKQVSFKNSNSKNNKSFRLSTKSNSVEVNQGGICGENNAESVTTPPHFSCDNYGLDQLNTTLSERVMIWLDLAIQNQKEFKNMDLKKRVVTAQACPISERKKKPNVKNQTLHYKYKHQVPNEKSVDMYQQIDSSKKEVSFMKHDNNETPPLLTSQMEYDDLNEINCNNNHAKVRSNTAKRQLHIFLPNLPKKTSENSSLLSSKDSSLLLTNKI